MSKQSGGAFLGSSAVGTISKNRIRSKSARGEWNLCNTRVRNDGEICIVEIGLGSAIEERSLSAVQFLVMCLGLVIVTPDFQLLGRQTGIDLIFSVVQCVLFLGWIFVGLFASTRFLFAPYPMVLSFTRDELLFDSGKAGLAYLSKAFDDQLGPVYSRVFERRRHWRVRRDVLGKCPEPVKMTDGRIQILDGEKTFELGLGVPMPLQVCIQNAVLAWIDSEPKDASNSAARGFDLYKSPRSN